MAAIHELAEYRKRKELLTNFTNSVFFELQTMQLKKIRQDVEQINQSMKKLTVITSDDKSSILQELHALRLWLDITEQNIKKI